MKASLPVSCTLNMSHDCYTPQKYELIKVSFHMGLEDFTMSNLLPRSSSHLHGAQDVSYF